MPSADSRPPLKFQQLSLFSQVQGVPRHEQVLSILAGITASQPTNFGEHHAIFEQLQVPVARSKKSNQVQTNARRFYHKLIHEFDNPSNSSWRLRVMDVPEPGVKQMISQAVVETILTENDLDDFRRDSKKYKLTSQYFTEGNHFVHGNVVVTLTMFYPILGASADFLTSPPALAIDTPPLDRSGSMLVEAAVRVEEGSSTALREQAAKELLAFAETVKGSIDFYVPDRLALDPRVKAGT